MDLKHILFSSKLRTYRNQAEKVKKKLENSSSNGETEKALKTLGSMSSKGNPYASYLLGDLYASGNYVEKDPEMAYDLYVRSYMQGNMEGAWKLAHDPPIYPDDHPEKLSLLKRAAERDKKTVIERLNKMGEDGDAEAFYFIGQLVDESSRSEWLDKAGDAGYSHAFFEKGQWIMRNNPSEVGKAIELFKRSATENGESAVILGKIYLLSRYIEEDIPESVKYFKIAKEKGYWEAEYWLNFIEGAEYGEWRKDVKEEHEEYEVRTAEYKESKRRFNFPGEDLIYSPEWFILTELSETDHCGYTDIEEYRNDCGCYENSVFAIRSYYWGGDKEVAAIPNFEYKPTGLEIEWYKYPFRESYMSQELNEAEIRKIWRACADSVMENIRELRKNKK
jgi:TPR repeat protein